MFVVLQPQSNTNPSDRFRVCHTNDWQAFVNGAKSAYAFVEFDDIESALRARDRMNISALSLKS